MTRAVIAFTAALGVAAATVQPSPPLITWPRGIEGQRKADRGDGTFLNPIMAGDHPDPSILRDGNDYYMTFSSFDAYPGLVIWHSRDLVNWQPIGPALFKNVGAVWAPDLVKHNGRYYMYFPGISPNRSNYVIWADHIRGPWSEPIDLETHPHRSRPRRGSGRPSLFVSERRRARRARARWAVDDRQAAEDLRRVEVSGRLGRRSLRAGGAEDSQARRLLLHGARGRRYRWSADRVT